MQLKRNLQYLGAKYLSTLTQGSKNRPHEEETNEQTHRRSLLLTAGCDPYYLFEF